MRWFWLALLLIGCSQPQQEQKGAPAAAPQAGEPGAVALGKNCGSCHAPPNATRHTAAEWPQVVARMELHRVQRGLGEIAPDERALLLAFLQAGAKAK